MTTVLTKEQKIERSKQLAKESYFRASIIDQIVNLRNFREGDEDFQRIYRRVYVPDEWFTRTDVVSDYVFQEFGSDIALGEKRFFVEEKILGNNEIRRNIVNEINLRSLEETARSLFEDEFVPTVLFAPIEYYVPFYVDWLGTNLQIGNDPSRVLILGNHYKIFWSNKYIPFKEFIFIDKSFGEWVSKPSLADRFHVEISQSDRPDQLDFTAYTTAKLSITEPRKIAILKKE